MPIWLGDFIAVCPYDEAIKTHADIAAGGEMTRVPWFLISLLIFKPGQGSSLNAREIIPIRKKDRQVVIDAFIAARESMGAFGDTSPMKNSVYYQDFMDG